MTMYEFIEAIKENNVELVTKLISHISDDDINTKYANNKTALHYAVINENEELVRKLIARMSDDAINATNQYGKTALHMAASFDKKEIVELLLQSMSDDAINAKDSCEETALHYAIQNENKEIVELLLTRMSEDAINTTDKFRKTALHDACQRKSKEIVELLLIRMNDDAINAKNQSGNTALDYAVKHKNKEIVELLSKIIKPDFKQLLKAVELGDTEIVKILLEEMNNEEINASESCTKETILYKAMEYENYNIVKLLLDRVDDCVINKKNWIGETLLHIAVKHMTVDIIELIINRMSYDIINAKDSYNFTALHAAIFFKKRNKQSEEVIKFLLTKMNNEAISTKDNGRDITSLLSEKSDILNLCHITQTIINIFKSNKQEIVDLILSIISDTKLKTALDIKKLLQLFLKSNYGYVQIPNLPNLLEFIELFIISIKDYKDSKINYKTEKELIEQNNLESLIQLLLIVFEKGENVQIGCRTALEFAKDEGYTEIVELIEKRMAN